MKTVLRLLTLSLVVVASGTVSAVSDEDIQKSFYPYNDWTPTAEGYEPGVVVNQSNVEQYKAILDEALYQFVKDGWVEVTTAETTDFPLFQQRHTECKRYVGWLRGWACISTGTRCQ